jgi:hypothetical protein
LARIAVLRDQPARGVELKIAGPREQLVLAVLNDEEPVAADGHVLRLAGPRQRTGREVDTRANLLDAAPHVVDRT